MIVGPWGLRATSRPQTTIGEPNDYWLNYDNSSTPSTKLATPLPSRVLPPEPALQPNPKTTNGKISSFGHWGCMSGIHHDLGALARIHDASGIDLSQMPIAPPLTSPIRTIFICWPTIMRSWMRLGIERQWGKRYWIRWISMQVWQKWMRVGALCGKVKPMGEAMWTFRKSLRAWGKDIVRTILAQFLSSRFALKLRAKHS